MATTYRRIPRGAIRIPLPNVIQDKAHACGQDMKKLVDSRKKILEIANFVIPGHGKMFKVEK